MSDTGWIGVDFDGTLAFYDGWNEYYLGDPIPLMVRRVRGWLANGIEVKIVTARVAVQGVEDGEAFANRQRAIIEDWCEKHIGIRLEVTATKDFQMIELWDDRAVQVIKNTGVRADGKRNKMKCDCKDWSENIAKVDAPRIFANARTPGARNYGGKVFAYCPWCSKPLVEEPPASENKPAAA